MSLDLGIRGWRIVGVVDGFVLATHAREGRSRWIDARTWPPKLLPFRDEVALAACRGAVLARGHVLLGAPDKRNIEVKTPGTHAAIGTIDDHIIVVPEPHVLVDGAWKRLAAASTTPHPSTTPHAAASPRPPARDAARNAVIGAFVICDGRIFRYDGALVETDAGELADGDGYVATDDGFITAAGGKLVVVTRHGKQREDRSIGKAIESIVDYDPLLVFDGKRYYAYDVERRTHEPFDLGIPKLPDALVATPSGLVALVDEARYLMRLRSNV